MCLKIWCIWDKRYDSRVVAQRAPTIFPTGMSTVCKPLNVSPMLQATLQTQLECISTFSPSDIRSKPPFACRMSDVLLSLKSSYTQYAQCTVMSRPRYTLGTVQTSATKSTRKPCYRKDDRAMRPIYRCPENFRESLSTPTTTFPDIFNGICSDNPINPVNMHTKFDVRSFTSR